MNKQSFKTFTFPLLVITFGGIMMTGLAWIGYYGIFLFVERFIVRGDFQLINVGLIRMSSALVFALITIPMLRLRLSDLIKATFVTGPIAGLMIAIILALYIDMLLALFVVAMLATSISFAIFKYKGSWFYYYALIVATVIALTYAWPR